MLSVRRFQKTMVLKAIKKGGLYENFGQKEIRELKDKYGYDRYDFRKRKIAEDIDFLDNWCMDFDDNSLKDYKLILGL